VFRKSVNHNFYSVFKQKVVSSWPWNKLEPKNFFDFELHRVLFWLKVGPRTLDFGPWTLDLGPWAKHSLELQPISEEMLILQNLFSQNKTLSNYKTKQQQQYHTTYCDHYRCQNELCSHVSNVSSIKMSCVHVVHTLRFEAFIICVCVWLMFDFNLFVSFFL
jgi:hypothetical protein